MSKELEKISSYRREIALAETWEEIKITETRGAAMAEIARRMDMAITGQNELGRTRIELEGKKGEKLNELYPQGGGRNFKVEDVYLEKMPITKDESSNARLVHREPVIAEEVMKEIEKKQDVITPGKVVSCIRKRIKIAEVNDITILEAKELKGVYDVVVIDPPWPMQKISRDIRPNQVEFDYPVMNEDELEQLIIPMADSCHVWLWTTHKFLPMALRLLSAWELKYVCTFVWHKPGGFQPIGLPQYNCEFALYARKGTPVFIDTKAFPVCFNAPRGKHSEKPEEFYEITRRVTGGRRLDMFSRREIEGFDTWGKEAI